MTKVISAQNDLWTLRKIQSLVGMETVVLKKQIESAQSRIHFFEERHGEFGKEGLHGLMDDMEIVEWEGEIATLERLQNKLARLEHVNFEYE